MKMLKEYSFPYRNLKLNSHQACQNTMEMQGRHSHSDLRLRPTRVLESQYGLGDGINTWLIVRPMNPEKRIAHYDNNLRGAVKCEHCCSHVLSAHQYRSDRGRCSYSNICIVKWTYLDFDIAPSYHSMDW